MERVKHFVMVVVLIFCAALLVLSQVTAYADDKLNSGESLRRGDGLTSANGRYKLLMQKDGNLVLYGPGNRPTWSTNTAGRPVERCAMQRDGNLVLYLRHDEPIWDSGTNGNPGSFLLLQNDGNLVIYRPVWSSSTQRPHREDYHDRKDQDREWDKWRY